MLAALASALCRSAADDQDGRRQHREPPLPPTLIVGRALGLGRTEGLEPDLVEFYRRRRR
jgi:hypothetical protein